MGADVDVERVAYYVRHEAFGAEWKFAGPWDNEAQAKAYIRRLARSTEAEIVRTVKYVHTDGTGRITKELAVA